MARFSLHAVGTDRPGIVAAVSDALVSMGWSLEDSAMTRLRGQFAIVLVLDAGDIADGRAIEAALDEVVQELDLFIAVRPVQAMPPAMASEESVTVSITAPVQPGIVARVAREIASFEADIIELVSRPVSRGGTELYTLHVVAVIPSGTPGSVLEERLRKIALDLGGDATLSLSPTRVE